MGKTKSKSKKAALVETTAKAKTVTHKDQADALVAKKGLVHARGRVYVTFPLVEAWARVAKGGKPEIVPTDGAHRTKGVLVFRLDDASVAFQNLAEPY